MVLRARETDPPDRAENARNVNTSVSFIFNNFEKMNERDSQYTVVNLISEKPARQRLSDGIGESGVVLVF